VKEFLTVVPGAVGRTDARRHASDVERGLRRDDVGAVRVSEVHVDDRIRAFTRRVALYGSDGMACGHAANEGG
jgi:hypothetical protein